MRKNLISCVITLILAVTFALGTCPVAFAASTNDPYGFTYDDSASGKTMYKYYAFSAKDNHYTPTKTFYSVGNTVYTSGGQAVLTSSAGSGSRYNGFSADGTFYMITNGGGLVSINASNSIGTVYSSGAIRLVYNTDDIAYAIETASGNVALTPGTTLTPSIPGTTPGTNPGTPPGNNPTTPTNQNRVELYTNSAGEYVYNAYEAGVIKLTLAVSSDEQQVLNVTNSVRLTDTLKGAKFLGMDTAFNVYLYETRENGGSLYCFLYGNWYAAQKIELDSAFKKLEKNENGFISAIITEKSRYPIIGSENNNGTYNQWVATHTYAVSKETYSTMYIKNSTKSYTLMLVNGALTLDGVILSNGVTRFGFISESTCCYITNGTVFTVSLNNPTATHQYICFSAANFKTNEVGLVTSIVLSTGETIKI